MVIVADKINISEHVRSRSSQPWLLDYHGNSLTPNFTDTFEHHYQQLQQIPTDTRLIIVDANPIQFLAKFLAACATSRTVFLGNPNWIQTEWEQVQAITHPFTTSDPPLNPPERGTKIQNLKSTIPQTAILIPTGGTSGPLRFAIHTWNTLTASVRGFQQHFHVNAVNTCCVLPLYHVSGLMQFMRSFLSSGQMILATFKELERSDVLGFDPSEYFLSLVPTQLARLHQCPKLLLSLQAFNAILLGGAPPWPALLDTARQHQLPLAPTYGMTETASQVATLRPSEFLASSSTPLSQNFALYPHGNNAGSVLPHAQISIRDAFGHPLPAHQTGLITIQAQSLALGYCSQQGTEWFGVPLPETSLAVAPSAQNVQTSNPSIFQSNDLGFLDRSGYLHVVGRQRDMIISGGENIAPTEVEAAIRATGLVRDVAVIGMSDRLWGEAITAIYVPIDTVKETGYVAIKAALAESLNRIKHPKHWIVVAELPCNEQGKVNRMELGAIAQAYLQSII